MEETPVIFDAEILEILESEPEFPAEAFERQEIDRQLPDIAKKLEAFIPRKYLKRIFGLTVLSKTENNVVEVHVFKDGEEVSVQRYGKRWAIPLETQDGFEAVYNEVENDELEE